MPDPSLPPRLLLVAVLGLLLLLAGGCADGTDDADDASGSETTQAAQSADGSASTDPEDASDQTIQTDQRTSEDTVAPGSAVRETSTTVDLDQLQDAERSTLDDPADDFRALGEAQDSAQAPLADLTGVSLVRPAGATSLFAVFEHAAAVPSTAGQGQAGASNAVLWQIQTWQDQEPLYLLEAALRGSNYSVSAFALGTGKQLTFATQPSVEDNRLVVEFPLDSLSELGGAFNWAAASEWDAYWGTGPFDFDTFRDTAPQASQDSDFAQPEDRVSFP